MEALFPSVHPAYMARRKKKHFLREWRAHRGLSLEQVAERVALLSQEWADADPDTRPITMTHATLSRIERMKLPYNQYLLELLSDIYGTDEASLIVRDPTAPDAIWDIYDQLKPVERVQLTEIARTLKRTGTDG